MAARASVRLVELRVLEGPNLYFTRPAIKLTLSVPGWLAADERRAARIAARVRLRGAARPGAPKSEQRRRFVARLTAHVTRSLAEATGTRLGVRSRPGHERDQVVVAYPWRRRAAAEALGAEAADLLGVLLRARRSFRVLVSERAGPLSKVEPGPGPSVLAPDFPVVAVTGTNGKTTTVRLLAHLIGGAGRSVAYTSTDGVYVDGRLVEEGDYSGPSGAEMALAQPGVEAAVLEVARGGILLKGMGTAHNDVAVVTNVSADHLGLHGVFTVDQLAEVKATITRITRPDGWCVLNADDPRVLAMRRVARGRPFLFSMDPDHPALRTVLGERGRAMAPIDGWLALLRPGRSIDPMIRLEEVPVTLAGISSNHVQNAMAATAAALGVGVGRDDVVRGLRTFVLDPDRNPGRANLFELDRRIVVIDYAHNEAGMHGLVEICRGLRAPGAKVWIAYGSAGDRSEEIMHALGYVAARRADHVAVVELHRYLRGRDPGDVVERLRAGALDGGAARVPDFPDEISGLRWMLDRSGETDVLAITALAQRREIFDMLMERGAQRVTPSRCRQLVRRARGAALTAAARG
ncbi:MAG: Mur ligase family protein [Actinomycetota bacterium]